MTYSLPFGLKQKPINKYLELGVIKFSIKEGVLHYTVRHITKKANALMFKGVVKSKEQLDQLLSAKTLHELQVLETVVQ